MSLTHYALLNAQPRERSYRLFDGHGLYLQVSPSGGKWWRVKYRFRGRENCLSMGAFSLRGTESRPTALYGVASPTRRWG